MKFKIKNSKFKIPNRKSRLLITIFIFSFLFINFKLFSYAEEGEKKAQGIIVNGDRVEYVTESKEFTAKGNVEVNYGGTKLTCDSLTLNTLTKEGVAEGHARLQDASGIIEGDKLTYNFNTQRGIITDAGFRSNPYFGNAQKLEKVSEDEFIIKRGYLTTCSYDNPHWRIKSKQINFFPGDKVQMRDNLFCIRDLPLMYIPQYNHSLREPIMHIQLMPGTSKEWGPYLLTATRYELTEDVVGRIYLDYRSNWGVAEGFGVKYKSSEVGNGNFKFYYTQERDQGKGLVSDNPNDPEVFQRYFIRWRHKWDVDQFTNAVVQYYKIVDSKRAIYGSDFNFLKDYFYREYEKDSLPLSYITMHRAFNYANVDVLVQKRVNDWYSQEEKLPEIKFTLPQSQIGNTPFYTENILYYQNFGFKTAVGGDSSSDITYNQYQSTNKISYPGKVGFLTFNPFASANANFYDKNNVFGSTVDLSYSIGTDLSTKLYRLFDVKSNFLGLDINKLRHIITPTAGYSYTNNSVNPTGKAKFGGSSAIGNAGVSLTLENRLQTKREDQSVDLATFLVTTAYNIQSKDPLTKPGTFSDIVFDLELKPYSWLRVEADATYKHTDSTNSNYNKISQVNYDINFDFAPERSVGIGQRYQREGGNEITANINWRFNPKWKISLYQSLDITNTPGSKNGFREQEYTLTRDLHCWIVGFTYNIKRSMGESIWLVFRLKAFPEMDFFEYSQSYHKPKPGSQSNP